MKQCPNCKTQYTDDTLVYCLQDGTPLAEVFTPGDLPDETATIVSDRTRARAADPTIVTGRPTFEKPRPRRTSTVAIVLLTAIATVLIVGFAAIGYVIYSRHKQKEDARFTPDGTTPNTASTPAPKPSATPSPTPSATPSATPTPINKNLITRDVSDAVSHWVDDTNSGDVDRIMRSYAETVDYYKSGGVNRDFVSHDKKRAFGNYDSIEVDVSNLNVSVNETGDAATAEFDKTWVFSGENPFEGSARSQLRFRKIDGRWLITGERDLKVYSKE